MRPLRGCLLGLALAGTAWPEPPDGPPRLPAAPAPPASLRVNPRDGAELIRIPAGAFPMGAGAEAPDADPAEQPQRTVTLDAYDIYRKLVTVAQYRSYCTATGRSMPEEPPWGWQNEHPIVNVTWDEAKAYCDWAGACLPTEAQWERAARGTDGRAYPWGKAFDPGRCACSVGSPRQATSPAGSLPAGASPSGCLDMIGNTQQWCADWFLKTYYATAPAANPTGPAAGTARVVRGAGWDCDDPFFARVTFRGAIAPDFHSPTGGFRAVLKVKETP